MKEPVKTKADVLQLLRTYSTVAFNLVLIPGETNGWMLHTLIVDAIPESYLQDRDYLVTMYSQRAHILTSAKAIFVAGLLSANEVSDWFDPSREITVPLRSGPGTNSRVVSTQMPVLSDTINSQEYFSYRTQNDQFGSLKWPHEVYMLYRTQQPTIQQDYSRLILDGANGRQRPYENFKGAYAELIYDDKDWDTQQRRSTDPQIAIRVVRKDPYLADVNQLDKRTLSVSVAGHVKLADLYLAATGGVTAHQVIQTRGKYQFQIDKDWPNQGSVTLMQGNDVVDEYKWDDRVVGTGYGMIPMRDIPVSPDSIIETTDAAQTSYDEDAPPEIRESLERFRQDHPDVNETCFIMMRFASTDAHTQIVQSIRDVFSSHNLEAVRADDKEYHDDLYLNILTYLYGCGFGVAVFERFKTEEFNPNVALEVGYMLALKKPVCLLKDRTLKNLQADLIGKLYRSFDPQHIDKTVTKELDKWLKDKGLA